MSNSRVNVVYWFFLIGKKIAKLHAAEKIDEHALTLKSISDALRPYRIGNVLR